MKQDHFIEDSKLKKMKWLVSTCPNVRTKWSVQIDFVWVIISFPFCSGANLLYFVYSAPSNMAAPISWGASGRAERHSLFCLTLPSGNVSSLSTSTLLGQKNLSALIFFFLSPFPCVFFLHSFSKAHFHPFHANIATESRKTSPPFISSYSCLVVV